MGVDVRQGSSTPAPDRASGSWLVRLAARSRAVNSVLCLGLDPDPAGLPAGFPRNVHGAEAFARLVLEAVLPFVAAVKPNLAFYEAFGSSGIAALERLRSAIPSDVPFLVDAKRGDIGSTAARQQAAIVGGLGAEAVTLNPYLGRDAVEPFIAAGAFVYLVCRTSNPAADEIQGMAVAADERAGWPPEPLYARMARVTGGWAGTHQLGYVVGATAPTELLALRELVPERAFLVPGIGAQAGDLPTTLRAGPALGRTGAGSGGALLVNVSRAISAAGSDLPEGSSIGMLQERIHAAGSAWAAKMPVLSLPRA